MPRSSTKPTQAVTEPRRSARNVRDDDPAPEAIAAPAPKPKRKAAARQSKAQMEDTKLEEAKRQRAQKARDAKERRARAKVAEETGYESEDDSDDDGTQAEVHHRQPVHTFFTEVANPSATTKTVKARKAKKPVVESESDDDKANDDDDKGNSDTSPKPALAPAPKVSLKGKGKAVLIEGPRQAASATSGSSDEQDPGAESEGMNINVSEPPVIDVPSDDESDAPPPRLIKKLLKKTGGVMPEVSKPRHQHVSPVAEANPNTSMPMTVLGHGELSSRKRPAPTNSVAEEEMSGESDQHAVSPAPDAEPSPKKRRSRNTMVNSENSKTRGIKQFAEHDRKVVGIAAELMKLEVVTVNSFPNETQLRQMAVKSWRGAHRLVEAASSTAKASSLVHTGPTVVPAMPDDIYNYVVGFVATIRGRFAALANASVAESYQLSSLSGDVLKAEQQRLTTGLWKPFIYKDAKAVTGIFARPLFTSIIADALFRGKNSLGVQYPEYFRTALPSPTLAFTLTAVEHAINTHGTSNRAFSGDNLKTMYSAHLSRFEDIDRLGREAQSAEGVDPKEQKNRMQQMAARILEIVRPVPPSSSTTTNKTISAADRALAAAAAAEIAAAFD